MPGDHTPPTEASSPCPEDDTLLESERNFRALFTENPIPMWVYDLDTLRFLEVNDAAVANYGFSREEFLGMTLAGIRPEEEIPKMMDVIAKQRRRDADWHSRGTGWRHRRKDGTLLDVELYAHMLSFRGKAAVLVLARDVTETNRLARERDLAYQRIAIIADLGKALTSSLNRDDILASIARLCVERLCDTCAILDEDFELVAIADRVPGKATEMRERFRRSPRATYPLAARALGLQGPKFWGDITDEVFASELEGGQVPPERKPYYEKSLLCVPLLARGRTVGVIRLGWKEPKKLEDLGGLEIYEELGRRTAVAVENAMLFSETEAALKVRGEFLNLASHELRTPLTSLKLAVQLLHGHQETMPPAQRERLIELCWGQVERLDELTDELLDVTKIDQETMKLQDSVADLCRIVRGVVERFGVNIRKSHCDVTVDCAEPVVGYWDSSKIDQVAANLLSNALKFGKGHPIRISVSKEGDTARLSVKDEGMGIDPSRLPHLFERFGRGVSSQHFGGLGLGLYISRRIVEAHRGSIRADSPPGQGAEFIVELPCTKREGSLLKELPPSPGRVLDETG